jgi:hypothetical protein
MEVQSVLLIWDFSDRWISLGFDAWEQQKLPFSIKSLLCLIIASKVIVQS